MYTVFSYLSGSFIENGVYNNIPNTGMNTNQE